MALYSVHLDPRVNVNTQPQIPNIWSWVRGSLEEVGNCIINP